MFLIFPHNLILYMIFDSIFFVIIILSGGLVATLFMTIFEIPFWRKWGLKGILEWHENQILYSKHSKNKKGGLNFFGIFLLHFINGGMGGLGFYLLLYFIPLLLSNIIIVGALYGLILWILTLLPIHKPITSIDPFNHPQGKGPIIVSLIGHLIYGFTLSWFAFQTY